MHNKFTDQYIINGCLSGNITCQIHVTTLVSYICHERYNLLYDIMKSKYIIFIHAILFVCSLFIQV